MDKKISFDLNKISNNALTVTIIISIWLGAVLIIGVLLLTNSISKVVNQSNEITALRYTNNLTEENLLNLSSLEEDYSKATTREDGARTTDAELVLRSLPLELQLSEIITVVDKVSLVSGVAFKDLNCNEQNLSYPSYLSPPAGVKSSLCTSKINANIEEVIPYLNELEKSLRVIDVVGINLSISDGSESQTYDINSQTASVTLDFLVYFKPEKVLQDTSSSLKSLETNGGLSDEVN